MSMCFISFVTNRGVSNAPNDLVQKYCMFLFFKSIQNVSIFLGSGYRTIDGSLN